MRIYLASVLNSPLVNEKNFVEMLKKTHILHSFAYAGRKDKEYIPYCKSIMMDSGAFTIMNTKKLRNNFQPLEFTRKYAEYIRDNNIELFIELDIEGVYGFDVYKDCLHCLQDITGKEPIYVFHRWRGREYYRQLVRRYNYVAMGDAPAGLLGSSEIVKYFPWFIEEAHKNNCKIHGLGFTSIPRLGYMLFDSVDSSSWKSSFRFASLPRFNGHSIVTYNCRRTEEKQLVHNKILHNYSFAEWNKFAEYFEKEMEPIW